MNMRNNPDLKVRSALTLRLTLNVILRSSCLFKEEYPLFIAEMNNRETFISNGINNQQKKLYELISTQPIQTRLIQIKINTKVRSVWYPATEARKHIPTSRRSKWYSANGSKIRLWSGQWSQEPILPTTGKIKIWHRKLSLL